MAGCSELANVVGGRSRAHRYGPLPLRSSVSMTGSDRRVGAEECAFAHGHDLDQLHDGSNLSMHNEPKSIFINNSCQPLESGSFLS